MRRSLVRRLLAFPSARLVRTQDRDLFPESRHLIGQLEHGLVLFGAVPLQVGITLLQPGQSRVVIHAPEDADCTRQGNPAKLRLR